MSFGRTGCAAAGSKRLLLKAVTPWAEMQWGLRKLVGRGLGVFLVVGGGGKMGWDRNEWLHLYNYIMGPKVMYIG